MQVRFAAEAASELEAAAAWYDSRRSGLGLVFIDAVEAALDRVAQWPQSGSLVDGVTADLDVRRVPVTGFPYQLPYLVLDDHLRVLAVAHDRRRPRYWTPRAANS